MNKSEFLHRLEEQLAGLPPEEKRAAMEYYTEYLQEAGEAGEADVLQELGDPAEVAAAILGARASQTEAEAEKNADGGSQRSSGRNSQYIRVCQGIFHHCLHDHAADCQSHTHTKGKNHPGKPDDPYHVMDSSFCKI